jgi:rhomboid protease GluP
LHGGLLHIGFNSYALMQVGPLVESQLERGRMLTLVTLTQVTSAGACWIFSPNNAVLGASGWIFGLIGYGIVFAHRAGISALRDALVRWAVFDLLFGLVVGGVSNSAHIGGLVGGLAFGTLPEPRIRADSISGKVWAAAGALSAVLWVVTLVCMAWSVKVHWTELQSP